MIRLADKKDYPAIYDINKLCHATPEPNVVLLEKLELGTTWIAEENGRVVGFLVSRTVREWMNKTAVNIYNIAVLPEFRGKGLASALIKECEKYYAGECEYFYLHVSVHNPAQKLYFDLGYRAYDLIRDYYTKGNHALKMWRSLGEVR